MAEVENASSIRERCAMLLIRTTDIVQAASDMALHEQQFTELASLVGRMKPILLELQNQAVQNASESLKQPFRDLEASMEDAWKLLQAINSSPSVWLLLLRSPDIFKKLKAITRKIAVSLGHLSLASLELSLSAKQKLAELCEAMKAAEFKGAVETEEVIAKLQRAFREEQTDGQENLKVLIQIANLTGASVDSSFVMREREAIQKEKLELEENKRHAEADILKQVMAFLSTVHTGDSSSARSDSSLRASLRRTGSIPIKAFCCRLTGKLMEDPVETSSGFHFERREIEAWFEQGNTICPVTKEPLESFKLDPNGSLAEAIREWKGRNVNKRLDQVALDLKSQDPRTAKESLSELCELLNIAERVNATLVVERLVELPRVFDESSVRREAMLCLSVLAHTSFENKVLITREGGAELAIECLGNENAEIRTQGMMALLDLSKELQLCGDIGKSRDCIPCLAALVSSQDTHLTKTAEEVLENLAGVSDNLEKMTRANYLKPLMHRITLGSENEKVCMAMLLGNTELHDDNISTLVQEGMLPVLVEMIAEKTRDPNLAALTALQRLSTHADTKEALLSSTNVVETALKLLRNRQVSDSKCDEIATKLLADLALYGSSSETHAHDADLAVLTDKENVEALVALLATAEISNPIRLHLLKILLRMTSIKTERGTKEMMRDAGAIQLLVSRCNEENPAVRLHTLMLLNILTEDGNGHYIVDRLEETHIKNFVKGLSQLNVDVEEKTEVSGILSNICTHCRPRIFDTLLSTDALKTVLGLLSTTNPSTETNRLIENALGVFLLYTSSHPPDLVLRELTEFKATSILVRILEVGETGLAKQRAATGLAQLSRNTMLIGRPVTQSRWRNLLGCCRQVTNSACVVHGRICSAEHSFCLVEANAIVPLVKTLGETEFCADEAALNALDTLLDTQTLGPGIRAIEGANGLIPVKLLLTNGSLKAKESVLTVLEKLTFFHEDFHELIGHQETHELIRLMQKRGDPIRGKAATILGNTGKIDKQSTYF